MQTTSENYAALLSDPTHIKEVKVTIAGTEYGEEHICTLLTDGNLYAGDAPAVGCCVAREIELSIIPQGDIPRMAEICVHIRLSLRDALTDELLQASEWIPKGVFYIDTRSIDDSGDLSLKGYDAMLKAEQEFPDDGGEWPRAASDVVNQIAAAMGVSIDARTSLDPDIMVPQPAGYTMREVLGQIGAAHVGNWVMSDAGALLLVPLSVGEAPVVQDHSYLVDENGYAITFGGVRIIV